MTVLAKCPTITGGADVVRSRGGVDKGILASPQTASPQMASPPEWRLAWDQIIDRQLVEWGIDPAQFADDGLTPPSRDTICLACTVAAACRDSGWSPPLRVAPDGRGGIVFERGSGDVFQTIEVRPDGSVEQFGYKNSRLCYRYRLS